MPEFIQTDENGKIIKKWYSVDPLVIKGLPNIIEVRRDVFKAITKFHKVVGGQVVEMTDDEKAEVIAEEKAQRNKEEIQRIENLEVSVKDVIIALIKRINARIPDNPITKEELTKQIKEDKGL